MLYKIKLMKYLDYKKDYGQFPLNLLFSLPNNINIFLLVH